MKDDTTNWSRLEQALEKDPLILEAIAWAPLAGDRPWALLRPDPETLRRDGFVNLYETLRFRAETAVAQLPLPLRPRGYSIARDSDLPRLSDGAADRERIARSLGPSPGKAFPPEAPVSEPVPAAWDDLVRGIVNPTATAFPLRRSTSLEFDLGLDSLDRLSFVLSIAETTGRPLRDPDPASLFTLGDVVDFFGKDAADGAGQAAAGLPPGPELVLSPTDGRPAPAIARPARINWPAIVALRIGLGIWSRRKLDLQVSGRERVNWSQRPMILAQNHQSVLDGPLLPLAVPPRVHRDLFSVGYAGYFTSGRGLWLSRIARIEPIDADRWALTGLRSSAAALRAGRVMVIYPEGERTNDGRLKPFRRSIAWLAACTGAHVVPSAINGSYQAWPRGWPFRPHPVRMTFGGALPPPCHPGDRVEEREWLERLRERIAELMLEVGADPERGDPHTYAHGPVGGEATR